MERHFLLPATIAAALHAGLMFGVRGGPAPLVEPVKGLIRLVSEDRILMPPEEKDPDPVVVDINEKSAKGSPIDSPPAGPEPTVVTIDSQDFVTPKTVTVPGPDRPTIPLAPPGVPGGSEEGIIRAKHGPFGVEHLDNPPRTRAQPAPLYPYEAKSSGVRGEVIVEFVVDEAGRVLDPHVVRSTDRLFEEPTLRAVSKWRFEPGKRSGRAVRFRMMVPVTFNLNE